MSKDAHRAQGKSIEAHYDAAQARCKPLKHNAKEVCLVKARGARDVAMAELEMQYRPTAKNDERLRVTRAEAAHALAREMCEPLDGNAKDVCRKDAKAVLAQAKAEAKLQTAAVEDSLRSTRVVEERTEAEDRQRAALFAAARERCDALAGEQRADCMINANKRFGKL
ncbi:hypothetical protein [Caenimonas sedimenti]|nr:hypothetical protein [Caenimonas sedimenti]